jgi:polyisoprenyl-teichoic acid--peptidoglycan teichoic acid transferase
MSKNSSVNSKSTPPDQGPNQVLSWGVLILGLTVGAVIVGFAAFFVARDMIFNQGVHGETYLDFNLRLPTPISTAVPTNQPQPTVDLVVELPAMVATPELEATLPPWDGKERVTVLIMGVDHRDWEAGFGAARSDTMMLLTMDPVTKKAGMLSVPRDLWVAIPGFTHGKINTAHALGEMYQLPGGGPALAARTVELVIGVPVHFYAVVDFGAFVRFIDELGGVKLDIPYKIEIDPLEGDNMKLRPGVQTLSGDLALAYARNRKKGDGDFDRARRQQQVLLGIRDRILDFELLPVLIQKAPILYRELVTGIRTNMKLDEVIKLAAMAQQIDDQDIRQGVIDTRYVAYGWSPDNLSILIPYPDRIRVLRDEIFSTSGVLGPLTPGDQQERMYLEGATVSILNATREPGLAQKTAEYLISQGVNVVAIGESSERYFNSRITDHVGRPHSVGYLVVQLNIVDRYILYNYDPTAHVDVEIIIGDDWAGHNSLP